MVRLQIHLLLTACWHHRMNIKMDDIPARQKWSWLQNRVIYPASPMLMAGTWTTLLSQSRAGWWWLLWGGLRWCQWVQNSSPDHWDANDHVNLERKQEFWNDFRNIFGTFSPQLLVITPQLSLYHTCNKLKLKHTTTTFHQNHNYYIKYNMNWEETTALFAHIPDS